MSIFDDLYGNKAGSKTTSSKERDAENSFRNKNNVPLDANRLPEAQDLYFSTIDGIWPKLCCDSKAQIRHLNLIKKELAKKDERFKFIYVVEPDINFDTGKPSNKGAIYADKGLKIEDATKLTKILLDVYTRFMEGYVLSAENKGRTFRLNDIPGDKINDIYGGVLKEKENSEPKK
jgi:hypothetical protein